MLLLRWPNPRLFHFFCLFFFTENCFSSLQDSNSVCPSRRRGRWPLDNHHHHGPWFKMLRSEINRLISTQKSVGEKLGSVKNESNRFREAKNWFGRLSRKSVSTNASGRKRERVCVCVWERERERERERELRSHLRRRKPFFPEPRKNISGFSEREEKQQFDNNDNKMVDWERKWECERRREREERGEGLSKWRPSQPTPTSWSCPELIISRTSQWNHQSYPD